LFVSSFVFCFVFNYLFLKKLIFFVGWFSRKEFERNQAM